MKKIFVSRLLLTAIAITSTFLMADKAAANTTRYYQFSEGPGTAVKTKITWKNINGLDSISGIFYYGAGEMYFNGKNSKKGYIYLTTETGLYMELWRQSFNNGFRWVGRGPNGEYQTLTPVTSTKKTPTKPKPTVSQGTIKTYKLFYRGTSNLVTLNWANIKGLGNVTGTIQGGSTITGTNYSPGKLNLYTGNSQTLNLEKNVTNGSLQWTGTITSPEGTFPVVLQPN